MVSQIRAQVNFGKRFDLNPGDIMTQKGFTPEQKKAIPPIIAYRMNEQIQPPEQVEIFWDNSGNPLLLNGDSLRLAKAVKSALQQGDFLEDEDTSTIFESETSKPLNDYLDKVIEDNLHTRLDLSA